MNDELERLRQFRAAEPPPTQAVTIAAREKLTELIDASPSVTSGASAAPREPTQDGREHAGSRSTSGTDRRGSRGLRGSTGVAWWRRRGVRPAAALTMICVAAAVSIAVGTGSTSPPSAAAAVLRRLASVAAAQSPVAAPRAGQYLHVASLQAGETGQAGIAGQHSGCTVLVAERRQIWISAARSGRVLSVPERLSFLSASGKVAYERWHGAVLQYASQVQDTWYAPGCYSLGNASHLQGSFQHPKALLRQMAQIDGGQPGPAGDFLRVGSFLRESDTSPALRAAIYRAAATIRGVRLLGTVTDRLGRRGIGMALTRGGPTSELIFNSRDSSMLAQQTTNRSGQLIGYGVYRPTEIVTRIPGHPPVQLAPACRGGTSYGRPGPRGTTIFTGRRQSSP